MKEPGMIKTLRAFVLGLALSGLAGGCQRHDARPEARASGGPGAAAPAQVTLDAAIGKSAQFSALAEIIRQTGLAGVLGGKASYTVFAPTNAAFDKLGEPGRALRQPEQRAALAALLREHIVPGMLTLGDLNQALERSSGKPLKLRSMGKGTLTVSREDGKIMVSGADGAKAALTNDSATARNGSALGIDGVLRKVA